MSNDANNKASLSHRRFVRLAAMTAALVPTGGALPTACGDATSTTVATTTSAVTANTTSAAATTAAKTAVASITTTTASVATTVAGVAANKIVPGSAAGVPDLYLALPAPYKSTSRIPGNNSTVKVFMFSVNPPPSSKSENNYWQELDKRLGITYDATMITNSSYPEKLAVQTASGDLGDLVLVDLVATPDQNKLIQQGAYADLTSYLTGDALKEFPNLAGFAPQIWKNSAIRGKIYGVPRPRFPTSSGLLYRKDWAEKVGITNPKNADEVYKLFEAFTNGDPDGDGKKNTWAMGDETTGGGLTSLIANQFALE